MKTNAIYNKNLKNTINCCIKKGINDRFYYVYKIIFPNGNYYIGLHRTKNLNDGYSGSGVLLHREFSRCNIDEVVKEILIFCDNEKEVLEEERKIIGKLYLTDLKCLNLVEGGSLGFNKKIAEKSATVRKGKKRTKESIEKQRSSCTGKKHEEKTRIKQSEWHKSFWKTEESNKKRETLKKMMKERVRSEEERKKISESRKKYYKTDYGILKKYLLYYKEDLIENNLYDFYEKCLENAKNNVSQKNDIDFLISFFQQKKKERIKKRYIEKTKRKGKYIFSEEHKKKH